MSKVEFVSYTRQSIGKLVSSSKHKYIWKLKIDEKDYTIDFYKSKRGRRSVFVNGEKVFEANILAADGATYPFTIKTSGRRLELNIFKVFNGEYDLRVGKISYFQALKEKQKSTDEIVVSHVNRTMPRGSAPSYPTFKVEDESDEDTKRRLTKPSLHSQARHKNNHDFGWPSKENFGEEESSTNHEAFLGFGKSTFEGNFKPSSNPFDEPRGFSTTKHTDRHFTFEPKTLNSEITSNPFGHAAKVSSHNSETMKTHSHIRHSSIEYPPSHSSQSHERRTSDKKPIKILNSEITSDPFGHASKSSFHNSETMKTHSHIRHSNIEYPPSHSSQSHEKPTSDKKPIKILNSEITSDQFGHASKSSFHNSETMKTHSHIRHSSVEYPHSPSTQSPQKRTSDKNPFNQPYLNNTSNAKVISPVKPISQLIDLVDLDSPQANRQIPKATQSVRYSTQTFTFPEVSKPSPNPMSIKTEANPTNPMMGNPMMGNPMMGNPMMGNPMMGNPMMGNPMMGNPMMGNPMMASPMMGNPMMASPMMGNPMMMNQYMTSMMMGQMMTNPYMQPK